MNNLIVFNKGEYTSIELAKWLNISHLEVKLAICNELKILGEYGKQLYEYVDGKIFYWKKEELKNFETYFIMTKSGLLSILASYASKINGIIF